MTRKKKKIKKAEQALQTEEKQTKCVDCKQTYPETEWQEWFASWDPPPQPPYDYQCEFCCEDVE